ncbi:MAG: hypothetical protein NPIRA02_20390 [Nitrospirales bacterium]|nr:MAG: hypothetical protein NPIRA02_20390 [Nitrospirales bacterium]
MFMKSLWGKLVYVGILVCILGLGGCGEDPQQLFETAKFEEQQGNRPHAIQLYEQIIQMDPNGDLAQTAKERIAALKK